MDFGYYMLVTQRNPMSPYTLAQKTRYRITLDIEAFNDFEPNQIDWKKLFLLQGDETCDAYVENLSEDIWWNISETLIESPRRRMKPFVLVPVHKVAHMGL